MCGHVCVCVCVSVQDAGLKVKEYELLRKNFSDSGNFGESMALSRQHTPVAQLLQRQCIVEQVCCVITQAGRDEQNG